MNNEFLPAYKVYQQVIDLELYYAFVDLVVHTSQEEKAWEIYRNIVDTQIWQQKAEGQNYFEAYNLRYPGEVLERFEEKLGKDVRIIRALALALGKTRALACSMRMGEITGLTWDCVHISDEEIARDDAFVWIEKELARVDQKAINAVGEKDILFVFPRLMGGKSSTRLVLKKPKTESSIRKVWIPRTLAFILREWKEKQDKLKEFMGDDYIDYNLVLAQETGRPCEDRIIGNQFERLKKSAGLPNVVFHSLRHSSTTYKLKINKGDVKATQGDTGHAQSDMVTQVYAHILDEDRKVNAQKFEMAFYANADLRGVEQRLRAESAVAEPDSEILLKQLEAKPELMDAFTKKFVEQYGEQIMNQLAKKLIGA